MQVLFTAGREPSYVRNAMLLKCLAGSGCSVVDCSDPAPSYPARLLKVLGRFLLRRPRAFDLLFVGFFGQPLVPILCRLTGKPIVFDAFLSGYDTMCFDRGRFRPDSLAGRFWYHLDRLSCREADLVLLDTDAHIDYFVETFGLPREKFRRLLVGADESVFYPRQQARDDGRFRVFYCSSYLPLHGTEHIVRAASLLQGEPEVEFVLVGQGPRRRGVQELAASLGAGNIRFIDWLPFERLPEEMAAADICLGGHFADSGKAGRVIAGKTFQFLAMRKPVIVGDGPGNRELLTDREDALFVPRADAQGLAQGILELKRSPALRERLAAGGYRTFLARGSAQVLRGELDRMLADSFPSLAP